MKKCSRCEQEQPLDNFPLRKAGEHTRRSLCKTCTNMYMKEYKKGYTIASDPVDQKINHSEVVPPQRLNIWEQPIYVAPKWGR